MASLASPVSVDTAEPTALTVHQASLATQVLAVTVVHLVTAVLVSPASQATVALVSQASLATVDIAAQVSLVTAVSLVTVVLVSLASQATQAAVYQASLVLLVNLVTLVQLQAL